MQFPCADTPLFRARWGNQIGPCCEGVFSSPRCVALSPVRGFAPQAGRGRGRRLGLFE